MVSPTVIANAESLDGAAPRWLRLRTYAALSDRSRWALGLSTVLNMGFMFALGKYIATAYGPVGAGYQGGLSSLTTTLAGVALMGSNSSIPAYFNSHGRPSAKRLTPTVGAVVGPATVAAFMLAVALVTPVMIPPFSRAALWTGVGIGLTGAVLSPLSRTFISIYRSPRQVALQQIIVGAVSSLTSALLLLRFGFKSLPVALGLGLLLAQAAASGALYLLNGRRARIGVSSAAPLVVSGHCSPVSLLRHSLPFLVSVAASQLAYSLLPFLVLAISGSHLAGLFRAAYSWGIVPYTVLLTAITFSLYPRLAASVRTERASELLRIEARASLLWASVIGLALSLMAPAVLVVSYSRDFLDGSACLGLICIGSIPRLMSATNTTLLMAAGARRGMLMSELFSGCIVVAACGCAAALNCSATVVGAGFLLATLAALGVSEAATRRMMGSSALTSLMRRRDPACLAACACIAVALVVVSLWATSLGQ